MELSKILQEIKVGPRGLILTKHENVRNSYSILINELIYHFYGVDDHYWCNGTLNNNNLDPLKSFLKNSLVKFDVEKSDWQGKERIIIPKKGNNIIIK